MPIADPATAPQSCGSSRKMGLGLFGRGCGVSCMLPRHSSSSGASRCLCRVSLLRMRCRSVRTVPLTESDGGWLTMNIYLGKIASGSAYLPRCRHLIEIDFPRMIKIAHV
jgi:hypothetical protein